MTTQNTKNVSKIRTMDLKGKKIILASGSPRRRELLTGLNIDFEVDTKNNFEERYSPETPHQDIPAILAEGKSFGFHRALEDDEILITSDTIVLCPDAGSPFGSIVMGKPHSREESVQMLRLLSGKTHQVITAVTVRTTAGHKTRKDVSEVHFKDLTDNEIDWYIDNCKPFDKAGGYGIQEWIGYIGIDRIEGSFYTIMGFPVHLVYEMINGVL